MRTLVTLQWREDVKVNRPKGLSNISQTDQTLFTAGFQQNFNLHIWSEKSIHFIPWI